MSSADNESTPVQKGEEDPFRLPRKFNREEYEARKRDKCYLPKYSAKDKCDEKSEDEEGETDSQAEAKDPTDPCYRKELRYRKRACVLEANQQTVIRNIWTIDSEKKNGAQNKIVLQNIQMKMDEAHYYRQMNLRKNVCSLSTLLNGISQIVEQMTESTARLETQRGRIKRAKVLYNQCLSITKGCIEIRATAPASELVMDDTEVNLRDEEKLLVSKMELFEKLIKEIEELVETNRKAKLKLEELYSNGLIGYNDKFPKYVDTFSAGPHCVHVDDINTKFKLEEVQSAEKHLHEAQAISADLDRQNQHLRNKIDEMLKTSSLEVRAHFDNTDRLLRSYIACLKDNIINFDRDLSALLDSLVKVDERIYSTGEKVHKLRAAWKNSFTDAEPEDGEVKCESGFNTSLTNAPPNSSIGLAVSELKNAEELKKSIIVTRFKLDFQLMCKRKSLWLNDERIAKQRIQLPCADALNVKTNE